MATGGTSGIQLGSDQLFLKAFLNCVSTALNDRRINMVDAAKGDGKVAVEIVVNPTDAVAADNYKLKAEIVTGSNVVADDYRIFNVNRTKYNNQVN